MKAIKVMAVVMISLTTCNYVEASCIYPSEKVQVKMKALSDAAGLADVLKPENVEKTTVSLDQLINNYGKYAACAHMAIQMDIPANPYNDEALRYAEYIKSLNSEQSTEDKMIGAIQSNLSKLGKLQEFTTPANKAINSLEIMLKRKIKKNPENVASEKALSEKGDVHQPSTSVNSESSQIQSSHIEGK